MGGFFSIDNMQSAKMAVHIAQAVLISISWCIMIAVFRNASVVVGGPIWYFILCFLTVPPLLYQTLTHRFEKSRKWGKPMVFAVLDVIYAILWLTAFASLAAWNTSNRCSGACGLSKGCVAIGFFIWLLFCIASAMSVYGVIYYERNGVLPGASRIPNPSASMTDPDREAWSTAPHDEDAYAPVDMNDRGGHDQDHDHDSAIHEIDSRLAEDPVASHTVYDPTRGNGGGSGVRRVYVPPTVTDTSYGRSYGEEDETEEPSNMGYDDEIGRVRFPAGNYHQIS